MNIKSNSLYQKIKASLQGVRDKIITQEDQSLQKEKAPTYKKIMKWAWYGVALGVLMLVSLFIYIANQDLPTFDELENPKSSLATEVYFSTGEVMGRYFIENRVNVDYENLNPHLINCLIATEDERYRGHAGIDARALARVAFKTVLGADQSQGGGSTITQQLAKLLYSNRNLSRYSGLQKLWELVKIKLKEWVTAVKLEKAYTKEEIMAMYLNKYDFINDSYGIRAAAETYFSKDQSDLNIEEAALLIGMLKNASLYNPNRFPDRSTERRNVVLLQTAKAGYITSTEKDSLQAIPLDMSNFKRSVESIGPAPYFRAELKKPILNILNNEDYYKQDGTPYNIYKDGLRIYTTIDSRMQKHLEDAVMEHMPVQQKKFWGEWNNVRKDPWQYRLEEDGEILTTDEEIRTRELSLQRLVWSSERYQNLKTATIGQEIEALRTVDEDFRITDRTLDRLYRESTEGGVITTLLSVNTIGSKLAAKYRKVVKSEEWKALLPRYKDFLKKSEEAFDQKVQMKVFAYNDQMETDTIMSPLDSIKYHRKILQIGSVAVDPVTGHVLAWVGGVNHKHFKYDHVTSERLVGSSFKPFIYATAISQQGLSPCFGVYDMQVTIHANEPPFMLPQDWSPENIDKEYSGNLYTLIDGLRYSKNTVSVFLMKQLGNVEQVRDLVRNMGIDVDQRLPNGQRKVPKVPAISLGTVNLSVLEMTGAYTTFANNGVYNEPFFISRIEDRHGRVIYEHIGNERPALNPVANYTMAHMLERTLNHNAADYVGLKSQMGGKTGTTNDYTDGWFMGISPNVVMGTWVGGDDPWIRFLTGYNGTGSRMARPVFGKFMKRVEGDSTLNWDIHARFNIPPGAELVELNCDNYDYSGIKPNIDAAGTGDDPFRDDPFSNDADAGFGDDPFGDDPFEDDPFGDPQPTPPDTTSTGGGGR